jgi:hypothetical protein
MDLAIKIADWIFFLSIIASFVVSLVYREKKDLRPIQLYIVLSIVINASLKLMELLPISYQNKNTETALINIFSILEISVLYYYFFRRISRKAFRNSMRVLLSIYLITCISLWVVKQKGIFFYSPVLFGFEGILLTIACILYILEILKSDSYVVLKANEHFIISCGILFYFGITTPSYLGLYNIYYIDSIFFKFVIISNYIFYTLLFITIMKAYLCITTKPLQ